MAGTAVANGDGTITVAFTYTAKAAKVRQMLGDAVHCHYPQTYGEVLDAGGNLIPFDNLTNQQILDVEDGWILKGIRDRSKQYRKRVLNKGVDAATNVVVADEHF